MSARNKPSLRHFAVLDLQHRGAKGKIYRVQDRRVVKSAQLLFVPNRKVSWPRYLSLLESIGGAPVRLRSTKVVFLLREEILLTEILGAIKLSRRKPWRFNSLTGFRSSTIRISRKVWLSSFISCLIGLSIFFYPKGSILHLDANAAHQMKEIVSEASACEEGIRVGARFRYNAKLRQLVLTELRQGAERVQLFGGFIQATVVSRCATKNLKLTAWSSGKYYEIASVN